MTILEDIKAKNFKGKKGEYLIICPYEVFYIIHLMCNKESQKELAGGWSGYDPLGNRKFQFFLIWNVDGIQVFTGAKHDKVEFPRTVDRNKITV